MRWKRKHSQSVGKKWVRLQAKTACKIRSLSCSSEFHFRRLLILALHSAIQEANNFLIWNDGLQYITRGLKYRIKHSDFIRSSHIATCNTMGQGRDRSTFSSLHWRRALPHLAWRRRSTPHKLLLQVSWITVAGFCHDKVRYLGRHTVKHLISDLNTSDQIKLRSARS